MPMRSSIGSVTGGNFTLSPIFIFLNFLPRRTKSARRGGLGDQKGKSSSFPIPAGSVSGNGTSVAFDGGRVLAAAVAGAVSHALPGRLGTTFFCK